MAWYRDEGTREEFMVIETAEKILNKREKEKKEQDEGKTKAERFVKALFNFHNRKNPKKTVLVFGNGDELIFNHGMYGVMHGQTTIFFHENDKEEHRQGNRELIVDRDWKLLLKMSERSDVVDIKI